jgi:hypothetical protein
MSKSAIAALIAKLPAARGCLPCRSYHRSRLNLIRLIPPLTELRVYDNSIEADPQAGAFPQPTLILHLREGRIVNSCDLAAAPEWTKPILLVALKYNNGPQRNK